MVDVYKICRIKKAYIFKNSSDVRFKDESPNFVRQPMRNSYSACRLFMKSAQLL